LAEVRADEGEGLVGEVVETSVVLMIRHFWFCVSFVEDVGFDFCRETLARRNNFD